MAPFAPFLPERRDVLPSMAMSSAGVLVNLPRRHPGHEATPEALSVERGEDIAEMIVARRPVGEGTETAQQAKLLLAKPRNVGETLRARQNR